MFFFFLLLFSDFFLKLNILHSTVHLALCSALDRPLASTEESKSSGCLDTH